MSWPHSLCPGLHFWGASPVSPAELLAHLCELSVVALSVQINQFQAPPGYYQTQLPPSSLDRRLCKMQASRNPECGTTWRCAVCGISQSRLVGRVESTEEKVRSLQECLPG